LARLGEGRQPHRRNRKRLHVLHYRQAVSYRMPV